MKLLGDLLRRLRLHVGRGGAFRRGKRGRREHAQQIRQHCHREHQSVGSVHAHQPGFPRRHCRPLRSLLNLCTTQMWLQHLVNQSRLCQHCTTERHTIVAHLDSKNEKPEFNHTSTEPRNGKTQKSYESQIHHPIAKYAVHEFFENQELGLYHTRTTNRRIAKLLWYSSSPWQSLSRLAHRAGFETPK